MNLCSFDCVFVEGDLEVSVVRVLLKATRFGPSPDATVASSNAAFLQSLNKYNNAAHNSLWVLALGDAESKKCVGPLIAKHVKAKHPRLVLRLAVPMVEAWLLADRDSIASFLGVAERLIPSDPDSLAHPKRTLLQLASKSPFRNLKSALVPDPKSGAKQGPRYLFEMERFAETRWNPARASPQSRSLKKAMIRLQETRAAMSKRSSHSTK